MLIGAFVGIFYELGLNLKDRLPDKIIKLLDIKIKPVESLKIGFSFKHFLIYGLLFLCLFYWSIGLFYGVACGLLIGFIFGLVYGLRGNELNNNIYANQGIKQSIKNIFIFSLIVLPLTIVFRFFGHRLQQVSINLLNTLDLLLYGLWFALMLGMIFAGFAVIEHFSLRLILWKNGSIPWNYARFLKYADERKLINQVGGRFTFIHDKLQEHFARM